MRHHTKDHAASSPIKWQGHTEVDELSPEYLYTISMQSGKMYRVLELDKTSEGEKPCRVATGAVPEDSPWLNIEAVVKTM